MSIHNTSNESINHVGKFDPSSIRKYTFHSNTIPRLSVEDPEVFNRMKSGLPVVITDSKMVAPALKWTLGYLLKHLGGGKYFVYSSKDNRFKYFDYKRADVRKSYQKTTRRFLVTFPQFVSMLKNHKDNEERIYLQQTIGGDLSKQITDDSSQFRWDLIHNYQNKLGWGSLTSNLLLIGLEGNITPVHYDEQENFFTQLSGYKRCILFSPDQFECLYPHPVAHPCDRQSQIDFENPDFERFPKFENAEAYETVVGPGDVLYIPMYWWHQIESLTSLNPTDQQLPNTSDTDGASTSSSSSQNDDVPPVTISLNFWYKSAPLPNQLQYPLTAQQRVAVMRNVEKMLAKALGDADEVGKLLRTMVTGRYDVK